MRSFQLGIVSVAIVLVLASLAWAGLLGSPVNLNTSETGTVTITPLGGPFVSTVGTSAEYQICVGPNNDNCVASGLAGTINISDTQVSFTFTGGTFSATGTFVVELSGFNQTITNVTYSSGAIGEGSFGLTSFTNHSMTFTGTVTGGGFGGDTPATVFNITSNSIPATPLPSSAILVVVGLGILAMFFMMRKRLGGVPRQI